MLSNKKTIKKSIYKKFKKKSNSQILDKLSKMYKHANLILISNPIIIKNFRNYEEQIISLNTILTSTLNYNINDLTNNKQDISKQIDNIKKTIDNNKTNLSRLKNLLKL